MLTALTMAAEGEKRTTPNRSRALTAVCLKSHFGIAAGPFLVRRVLRIGAASEESAEHFYRRYGVWSLLFSWLPVLGDPLCLAGGILKVGFGRFSLRVFTGKLVRYTAVAWLTLEGMQMFKG